MGYWKYFLERITSTLVSTLLIFPLLIGLLITVYLIWINYGSGFNLFYYLPLVVGIVINMLLSDYMNYDKDR